MSSIELVVNDIPKTSGISDLSVGGDILELMTKALYVDPMSIYREYIQNSADAIDDAVSQGDLLNRSEGRIDIHIDRNSRSIRIRDNGAGVTADNFESILTSLGGSQKRGAKFRGFRGIGRLGGLAFAQKLVFRSRSKKGNPVKELAWDGKRLKQIQVDSDDQLSIESLVAQIVELRTLTSKDWPDHFFEVEMLGVARIGYDDLLNETVIRAYLEEVAPLPVGEEFQFKDQLDAFLEEWKIDQEFRIYLNDSNRYLVRPFRDKFHLGKELYDEVKGIDFFEVPGEEGIDAVGWTFDHSFLGSIPSSERIGGIRARVGNLQVGGRNLFSELFPQKRFNAWTVGEVHILNEKIRPNSRRDDFETNVHHQNLRSHIVVMGRKIASKCRKQSAVRNSVKRCEQLLISCEDILVSYQNGLFSANQARSNLDQNILYLENALPKLEGNIHAEYQAKCSKIKEDAATKLSDESPLSIFEQLPEIEKNALIKVAEVINLESANPEFAARLISKIVEHFKK